MSEPILTTGRFLERYARYFGTRRVEAIEKTRQPSTSVEGDGDTDTTTTEKSMWSGVL